MRGIVYVSEALMYFDSISLEGLAAESASRNYELGITGYLYFEKDRFVQYIEGDCKVVDALMESIRRDKRHKVLHYVVEDNIEEPRFPSWHMRYLSKKELVEINLEHVLTDYLMYLDSLDSAADQSKDSWENVVWGMVNHLSSVRGKLGFH